MSQCPFANLVDPDTYSHGMPYAELQRINKEGGPVSYIQDPITGIPYWAITGQAEMDFISKSPKLFSSRERLAFPMEFSDDGGALNTSWRSHMNVMAPMDRTGFDNNDSAVRAAAERF